MARPDPTWHLARLEEAERENNAFAAAFHLDRLLRLYPIDAGLHVRKAHLLARQGKADAALHLTRALLLNPRVRLDVPKAAPAVDRPPARRDQAGNSTSGRRQ